MTYSSTPEVVVNANLTGDQLYSAVAGLSSTAYAVAWQDDNTGKAYVRIFDAEGNALTSAVAIDAAGSGAQVGVSIAAYDDGSFVVSWAADDGVFVQRYDFDGTNLTADGTKIATDVAGTSTFGLTQIEAKDDGGFVIAWQAGTGAGKRGWIEFFDETDTSTSGGSFQPWPESSLLITDVTQMTDGDVVVGFRWVPYGDNVYAYSYNSTGTSTPVKTNSSYSGTQNGLQIVELPDGEFMEIWYTYGGPVNGRVVLADGQVDSNASFFEISDGSVFANAEVAAAVVSDGKILVVWDDGDAGNQSIYGQLIDFSGQKIDSEFLISDAPAGLQVVPEISTMADGKVVVSWQSNESGDYDVVTKVLEFDSPTPPPSVADPAADHQINTEVVLDQTEPSVATFEATHATLAGGHVIVWQSDGQDGDQGGIYGQLYDSAGQPVGFEFQVNANAAGDQKHAQVDVLANGNFLVAWYSEASDGTLSVHTQEFSWNGSGLDVVGAEQTLDASAANYAAGWPAPFDVEALDAGGHVISWFDSAGVLRTNFYDTNSNLVNSVSQSLDASTGKALPALAELSDGRVLVTWTDWSTSGSRDNVHGRIFDASGVESVSSFILHNASGDRQSASAADSFSDGGFVVVWNAWDGTTVDHKGMVMRLFDANGIATTAEIQVSAGNGTSGGTNMTQSGDVVVLADDTFVVFWQTTDVGNDVNVYGQRFDAQGGSIGDAFVVHAGTTGTQADIDAALNADGEVVVTWQSDSGDGNGYDIEARILDMDVISPVPAPTPPPVADPGTDHQINTEVALDQTEPSVATFDATHATLAGGHVIVWQSDGQDGDGEGVYGQLYDGTGQPVGFEFKVSSGALGDQAFAAVATLDDGTFVVTWMDNNKVVAQKFDWDGTSLSTVGNELTLDTSATSTSYVQTDVAALSGGAYVVSWYDNSGGSIYETYSQIIGSDGTSISGLIQVSGTKHNIFPSVTELSNGNILYTWIGLPPGASSGDHDAMGRIFDASGNAVSSSLVFNVSNSANDYSAVAAATDDGGFISVWHTQDGYIQGRFFDAAGSATTPQFTISSGTIAGKWELQPEVLGLGDSTFLVAWEGGDGNLYGQRIDAQGIKIGDEFIVHDQTAGTQSNIDLALNADGEIVVTWQSDSGDGNGYDIEARVLDIDAISPVPEPEPQTPPPSVDDPAVDHQINTEVALDQTEPGVATFAADHPTLAGGHVIVWQSDGQDGDGWGVYGQLYGADGQPAGYEFQVSDRILEDQANVSVAVLADGNLVISWTDAGLDGTARVNVREFQYDGTSVQAIGDAAEIGSSGGAYYTDVTALSDGGYVLSWSILTSYHYSYAQIYDADGNNVGATTQFSQHSGRPSATELSDGRVLYTWHDWSGSSTTSTDSYAQIVNADGSVAVGTFSIAAVKTGQESNVLTGALSDGGFVAAWYEVDVGIQARHFDASGAPTTPDIVLHTGALSNRDLSLVMLPDDGYVVFWEQSDTDGTAINVYGQRMGVDGLPVGDAFLVNELVAGDQSRMSAELNADGEI
ncbi:hypothetical protein, partial [Kordiimonas sp. UBA4487]